MNRVEYQKKISKSGGVTLPSALRRNLALEAGEHMCVHVNDKGEIVLARINGTCVVCGGHEELAKVKGRFVCQGCVDEIVERNLGGTLFEHANG